jgi:two-component system sensor histidine kinase CpxA
MRSLFLKIFLWFWVTVVVVGLTMVLIWSMERDAVMNRWRAGIRETIPGYASEAAAAFDGHGLAGLNGYLQDLEARSGIRATLLDDTGFNVSGRSSRIPKPLIEQALQSSQPEFTVVENGAFGAVHVVGPSGRSYLLAVRMAGGPYGYRLNPRAQWLRWALAIVLSGLICYLLTRYLTRPILNLSTAARQLAAGDLSARAKPAKGKRWDEIGELVQDFNRMAERIEGLVSSQRQLISDISHELRSPLARLNVALGLARQRAGSQASGPLDRIEQEADRLNELIGRLLALARMEAASGPPEQKPIDLNRLLAEVVADAEFEAQERDCRVEFSDSLSSSSPFQPCRVMGSAELLRSAVENVVRNAVRYTAAGTPIEVTLSVSLGWALVTVRDHGPGIPDTELENVFRPFYRVAGARERETGGAGLGLAIAERAVRLHGGDIRAANQPEKAGLTVQIRLPLINGPGLLAPSPSSFTLAAAGTQEAPVNKP